MSRLVIATAIAIGIVRGARADTGRVRPPARIELADCLQANREIFEQAARVEIGERSTIADEVLVTVTCAEGGIDAGVVIEVRPPGSTRRYAYALDWRRQPVDMRPRLVGLAVAEAIDASQIELTALPSPVSHTLPIERVERWSLGLSGFRRTFSHEAGLATLGAGATLTHLIQPSLRLAIDVLGEGDTAVTSAGAIDVLTVSTAPRVLYRVGDRRFAEGGLGARLGLIHMRGEVSPEMDAQWSGRAALRTWFGPMATAGLGARISDRLAIEATVEVGISVVGSTARVLGVPAASVDGTWLSIAVATTVAL